MGLPHLSIDVGARIEAELSGLLPDPHAGINGNQFPNLPIFVLTLRRLLEIGSISHSLLEHDLNLTVQFRHFLMCVIGTNWPPMRRSH